MFYCQCTVFIILTRQNAVIIQLSWVVLWCEPSIRYDVICHESQVSSCCLCVVPVKVVDVLNVTEQRALLLRAQGQPRLVTDTLQVVLQRESRKKAVMSELHGWHFDWHQPWQYTHTHTFDFDRPLTLWLRQLLQLLDSTLHHFGQMSLWRRLIFFHNYTLWV